MRALSLALLGLLVADAARAQCDARFPALCGLAVNSLIEQPDLERAIDIVLVGDGFVEMDAWRRIAQDHIDTIRGHRDSHIYPAVPNVYNFHVVEVVSETTQVRDDDVDDTALGAISRGQEGITADGFKASLAAANAPDVDVLYLVANSDGGRANANFPSQLASGGQIRMPRGTAPATHELGHAVARLGDEYVENSRCQTGSEAQWASLRNATNDRACFKYSTTEGAQCREGNLYCRRGVYRAAGQCLMRANGDVAPCPVCRRAMDEQLLERRTGVDVSDPWGVVLVPPAGATLAGFGQLQVVVWDDYNPSVRAAFELDGAFLGEADVAAHVARLPFDSREVANGPHALQVTLIDAAGNRRRLQPVEFSIANGQPDPPPEVQVLQPEPGAELVGGGSIFARALDDAGRPAVDVEQMVIRIDDVPRAARAANFIGVSWDTSDVPPGAHVIEVTARDQAQNVATSGPIPITVVEAEPGGDPPQIRVALPRPWTAVGEVFGLSFFVAPVRPTMRASLWLDGEPVAPNPLENVAPSGDDSQEGAFALVDASQWALGPHQVAVVIEEGEAMHFSAWLPVVRAEPDALSVDWVPPPGESDDDVEVEVFAGGPAPISTLSLEVEGIGQVARADGEGRASLTWSGAPAGCHALFARAADVDGRSARTASSQVCVIDRPPRPRIVAPSDGARVAAGVTSFEVVLEPGPDGRRARTTIELWADDERLSALGGVFDRGFLPADLAAGRHVLRGEAVDPWGRRGVSDPIEVFAEDCALTGCDDENPCTEDLCTGSGLCFNILQADCCAVDEDCADADACTADRCDGGACVNERAEDCCAHDGECPSAGPCSVGRCAEGACAQAVDPSCCEADEDCADDDGCTVEACVLGRCAVDRMPGCCLDDGDCDDGNPCNAGACVDGQCQVAELEGCCVDADACDDGDRCTVDRCEQNECVYRPRAGCCAADDECESLNPCVAGVCNVVGERGTCLFEAIADCCAFASDCEDEDACTVDRCVDNLCRHEERCCEVAADCEDGDRCTAHACEAGFCVDAAVEACCRDDAECEDGDVCSTNACVDERCVVEAIAGCCDADADCGDGDVCTRDACVGDACENAPIPECCNENADCEDGDACTSNTCADHACSAEPVPGCCNADADCQDGDACTRDACIDDGCTNTAILECCNENADCEDGDVCTRDACVGDACTNTLVPGCCNENADCEDDDACTNDFCANNACLALAVAGCCHVDADCDDGDACTRNTCVDDVCVFTPTPDCCNLDADCDDGDACTVNTCRQHACVEESDPECCAVDADCDDGDACTTNRCVDRACIATPTPDCCETHADCDTDDPCTVGSCDDDVCFYAEVPGCCHDEFDCDDGDACTLERCVDHVCEASPDPDCADGGFEPDAAIDAGVDAATEPDVGADGGRAFDARAPDAGEAVSDGATRLDAVAQDAARPADAARRPTDAQLGRDAGLRDASLRADAGRVEAAKPEGGGCGTFSGPAPALWLLLLGLSLLRRRRSDRKSP